MYGNGHSSFWTSLLLVHHTLNSHRKSSQTFTRFVERSCISAASFFTHYTLPALSLNTLMRLLIHWLAPCVCVCVNTVQLYNCSVGQSDCSQCRAVTEQYGCVWCGGESPHCAFHKSCSSITRDDCPPPLITEVHYWSTHTCFLQTVIIQKAWIQTQK